MIVRHLPLIRGAKMNQGAKMNCSDRVFFDGNGETYMKCWEAQNLLKSMFCCDMSNFFWWKWRNLHEMLRSTKSAEKHVCCDMSIFLMEMAKLTWNAEKHKICWKACFVVTCLIFWWKWRNLHEMLRSTKSAEKHVLLWHVYFFDGNGETYMKCWEAGHAEKQKIFAEKHVLLWHVYFFWWKKLKLLMFDWGTFKKHPNWN
jgi:uncharacterized C2H2 Zn-finger protein